MGDIFVNLLFDTGLTDPRKKVGRVFQYLDKTLESNGIVGTFPENDIAAYIIKVLNPKESRQRVEYEVSSQEEKQTVCMASSKSLTLLYNFLVQNYTLWYQLFPTGFTGTASNKKQ